MDLQTRKLNAIGYLISLQDETIFSKIESTILKSQSTDRKDLKPFTKKHLLDRAKRSNDDYLGGRFKTQAQLELESNSW